MGVGWIDRIYNNTGKEWYLKSIDDRHNGEIKKDGKRVFLLDDGKYHALSPHTQYHTEWCGIPWYYQGKHFKAISADQKNSVEFCTSELEKKNWILYVDGQTGEYVGRKEVPSELFVFGDFRCWLRIADDGFFIDLLNKQHTPIETATFIYNELKVWVPILGGALGGKAKDKAEGKPG